MARDAIKTQLTYQLPQAQLVVISLEGFVATIKGRHQGRLMRNKLRALHYAARTSIGIEASAWSVSMEISLLVEKFNLIKRHIRIIDGTLVKPVAPRVAICSTPS